MSSTDQNAPPSDKTSSRHSSEPKTESGQPNTGSVQTLQPLIRWTGDGLGDRGAVVLRQVNRIGNIAIYSRTKESSGKLEGYDVIRIRVRTGGAFSKGAYEVYPSANEFGPYGRYLTTLARAEEVFAEWTQP